MRTKTTKPPSADKIRRSLNLPSSYRIKGRIEHSATYDGRSHLLISFALSSVTPGTAKVFATWDAGSSILSESTKADFIAYVKSSI